MIDWIVNQFREMFDKSSAWALEQVVALVSALPYANLGEQAFQQDYAVTWAFAVIVSVMLGVIASIIALGRTNSIPGHELTPTERLFFFLKVALFGFVVPVIYGIALWLGQELTDVILAWPQAQDPDPWYINVIENFQTISVPFIGWFVSLMTTIMTIAVWAQMVVIIYITIPIALWLTPAFSFSVLGGFGLGMFRFVVGLATVTVFAKPIILFLLTGGSFIVVRVTDGPAAALLSLVIIGLAAVVPFFILGSFRKRISDHIVSPMPSYTTSIDNSRSALSVGVTAALTIAGLKALDTAGKKSGNPLAMGSAVIAGTAADSLQKRRNRSKGR